MFIYKVNQLDGGSQSPLHLAVLYSLPSSEAQTRTCHVIDLLVRKVYIYMNVFIINS